MRFKTITAAAALATAAVLAAPAFATVQVGSVQCDSSMTVFSAGYIECAGPISGHIGAGQVDTVAFAGHGSFVLAGMTSDASGAFSANPGAAKYGTLTLGKPASGEFAIGLQGTSGGYSVYLFDGAQSGVHVDFDTFGVTDALGHSGPALANASLFLAAAVPEPATNAMLLVGLGGLAAMLRSRGRRGVVGAHQHRAAQTAAA